MWHDVTDYNSDFETYYDQYQYQPETDWSGYGLDYGSYDTSWFPTTDYGVDQTWVQPAADEYTGGYFDTGDQSGAAGDSWIPPDINEYTGGLSNDT